MEKDVLKKILEEIRAGRIDIDEGMRRLRTFPFEDIGYAKIDTHRSIRKGFPEVIFCKGKDIKQIKGIFERSGKMPVLATKADKDIYRSVKNVRKDAVFYESAGIIFAGKKRKTRSGSCIAVVSAGTSDIPVAEEAAVTSEVMGNKVDRIYDVGAAGLHRMLACSGRIFNADVIIAIAGMDGVLPTIISGMALVPVIAVPTSVGYGANFNGIAPLLTMLNSCSPGISVVNIDNGFGAGYMASMINNSGGQK